jgi:hypothetical protein
MVKVNWSEFGILSRFNTKYSQRQRHSPPATPPTTTTTTTTTPHHRTRVSTSPQLMERTSQKRFIHNKPAPSHHNNKDLSTVTVASVASSTAGDSTPSLRKRSLTSTPLDSDSELTHNADDIQEMFGNRNKYSQLPNPNGGGKRRGPSGLTPIKKLAIIAGLAFLIFVGLLGGKHATGLVSSAEDAASEKLAEYGSGMDQSGGSIWDGGQSLVRSSSTIGKRS